MAYVDGLGGRLEIAQGGELKSIELGGRLVSRLIQTILNWRLCLYIYSSILIKSCLRLQALATCPDRLHKEQV